MQFITHNFPFTESCGLWIQNKKKYRQIIQQKYSVGNSRKRKYNFFTNYKTTKIKQNESN